MARDSSQPRHVGIRATRLSGVDGSCSSEHVHAARVLRHHVEALAVGREHERGRIGSAAEGIWRAEPRRLPPTLGRDSSSCDVCPLRCAASAAKRGSTTKSPSESRISYATRRRRAASSRSSTWQRRYVEAQPRRKVRPGTPVRRRSLQPPARAAARLRLLFDENLSPPTRSPGCPRGARGFVVCVGEGERGLPGDARATGRR